MGSTIWKGRNLTSGVHTFIGGKEVELDVAVSASQLPTVQGMQLDNSVTDELVEPPSKQPARFLAPINFYSNPKPKAKEPL